MVRQGRRPGHVVALGPDRGSHSDQPRLPAAANRPACHRRHRAHADPRVVPGTGHHLGAAPRARRYGQGRQGPGHRAGDVGVRVLGHQDPSGCGGSAQRRRGQLHDGHRHRGPGQTATGRTRFDVTAVRHDHRIEVVVAASGVELTQRGRGFMGCCPFHDDSTPSLSVGGVPDRFHCFGCGAGGDVIEYVHRFTGLSFTGAVHALQAGTAFGGAAPSITRQVPCPARAVEQTTTPQRARAINNLAWELFTSPASIDIAETYLRDARGIDIGPLCEAGGGEPIDGYAKTEWRSLTRHLKSHGVTTTELLELDLAQRSRTGELIDTYRGRLIVPVLADGGGIDGFIGRDTTGDPRAPKYRNPTKTPTFDKSTALYRPTHHGLDAGANLVVVEGVLDALAIAAAAAQAGEPAMFAPATTSGITVSGLQARSVLALHPKPPVIALDGDQAGQEGTDRWLTALCIEHGRTALATRLPDGLDPAEWLQPPA